MKKYRSRTKSKAGSRDRHAGSKTDPGRAARPISSLTVTAWARRADKTNWQKQLEFEDRDGDLHRILISNAKARNGTWLFDTLDAAGCPLPTDDAAFKELKQSIIKADPKRRLLIVERPGWHGARFLLGNESIGKGTEELVLASNIQPHCARVTQRGSLKDWGANIAEPSAFSSYLVFALCVAFAAPLLRLTNTESGGFHFWGESSKGKSTAQLIAATIFGNGEREGGYSRKCKTTAAAMDETALGHSDFPLILDELKLLASDPIKAAQLASEIAYSIASGTPKARSVHFSPTVPSEMERYRTLLLSSGERSLSKHAQAGGYERLKGEEARLIDVPVPAEQSGIFDRLPQRKPTLTSGLSAEKLRESAAQTYGTAGRAYVEALVADCADERALRERLSRRCLRFLHEARVDVHDAYAVRFANRFALAYAAGLLAIDYGIVPWKRSLVWRCVRRVYRRAISMRASAPDPLQSAVASAVAKVLDHLPSLLKQAVDIDKCMPREGRRAAADGSALRLLHTDGQPLIALRQAAFKKIIGTAASEKAVAAELQRRGLLIPRGKSRRTRQVRVPGVAERRGYYCIIIKAPNQK